MLHTLVLVWKKTKIVPTALPDMLHTLVLALKKVVPIVLANNT